MARGILPTVTSSGARIRESAASLADCRRRSDLLIHDQGTLNVFDATTGEELWRKRLDGGLFSASPILAGGNLYFCSHEGPVTVIRPGREPEVLAVNEFDQGFMSSPAVSGDSLFLRSRTHLYRIDP
ncbi:MAG: PQQ-binding-like beta-propeller repeat protein [Pirellulaceae bacterium]